MRDRDPFHLHPFALEKMRAHRAAAEAAGIPIVLAETWRDPAVQEADYRKGRDEHGNVVNASLVVTRARPGQSWHNLTRWVRLCSDCDHEGSEHGPTGDQLPAFRSCLACGRRCLAVNVVAWRRVPASLAWHFYIRDDGDEAPGSLEGIGSNTLSKADRDRYAQLGALSREIPNVRWLGDTDGDGIPFEAGEWDLGHFEARPPGATLAQVAAVLSIQGGDLVINSGGLRA